MKKTICLLMSILACPVFANWQLNSEKSNVNFITFKKEHVAEINQFERVNATIDNKGKVNLTIDLTSVNTNIQIRDQRINSYLFNTDAFPNATFTSQLDNNAIAELNVGRSERFTVTGKIALHGQTQEVSVELVVAKLTENNLLVTSATPLLIHAQDFDLVKGINELKKLANLPSISYTVPVSFVLSFTLQ